MNVQTKETKAAANPESLMGKLPTPPKFANHADERLHRKQRLAAGFRLFSKFGFDEGVAGHITARDPEFPDTFWVNPFGVHFSQIKVSNLIRCDHKGAVVEGDYPVNTAAFVIHSRVHAARPDVLAAAHSHSTFGRAFSTLGARSRRSPRMFAPSITIMRFMTTSAASPSIWTKASGSPRRSARRKRRSCRIMASSRSGRRSTRRCGGSSPWSGRARCSSWPRRR